MNPIGSSTYKCLECHERFQTEWVKKGHPILASVEQVLCFGTHTPVGMSVCLFKPPPAPRADHVRLFPIRRKMALNGQNGRNGRKRSERSEIWEISPKIYFLSLNWIWWPLMDVCSQCCMSAASAADLKANVAPLKPIFHLWSQYCICTAS